MVRAKFSTLAALISLTLTAVAIAQDVAESPATEAAPDYSPDPWRLGGSDPHWVATADALFLQRSPARTQQLLYDPGVPVELLDASNFGFSTSAGPRLSLRREDPAGLGLEVTYFGIDGWHSAANFPNSAIPSGVGYLSIDDTIAVPITDAEFQYTSRLYSGEVNLRHSLNDRLTSLAGFRWVDFEDRYEAEGTTLQFAGPFTHVVRGHNHLYGAQIGLDARLLDPENVFQIDVLAKTGVYGDAAAQNNNYVDTGGHDYSASATGSRLSFLGEIEVATSCQLTRHLALRGGYQLMWLTGVALAPDQISATDFGAQAGVNTSGTLFCHGAHVGLEATW